jgi:LmbE family N-acetylglucosaminyl deacetylase
MRVLLVCPHPDDAEFTCAGTCLEAVRLGWDVHELLMTSDEYGTPRPEFKGKRIKHIRMHEMVEAAKAYGTSLDGSPKIHLHWFGEIDGYLPFTPAIFQRMKRIIEELKPRIVFGPDSFFTMDYHVDHMHAGWLVYLAIRSMPPQERPMLLLYHSTSNNFYLPINNLDIQVRAWSKHQSQTTPLSNKIVGKLRVLFYIFRRRKIGAVLAEGFRRVTFEAGENIMRRFFHKVLHNLFIRTNKGFPREYYLPSPADLGLHEA